jgi:hypothetical protein
LVCDFAKKFENNRYTASGPGSKLLMDIFSFVLFFRFIKFSSAIEMSSSTQNFSPVTFFLKTETTLLSCFDLIQACANLVPGGSCGPSVWGTSRQDMILKFGTKVKDVKWGPRNFFWVRIFSGDFRMELQRDLVVPGFWATGKRWEAEILQGASLIQFRTSKFYSAQ